MLSFFYGILFLLAFYSQSDAFLFTPKPVCHLFASECLDCEIPGFYPSMYCPRIKTGDMCYIKVVHNDTGIFTIKGAASTSFCEANKYKNSLSTPSCRTGNLPRGTECIDCCKQYSCDPQDLYCNKNIIQPEHMAFTVTTRRTTPPTTVRSTTATTPQSTAPSTSTRSTTTLSTSTQAPGLCQVCAEGNSQNCDVSSIYYCNEREKYCMNTIVPDPKGGLFVLKKCADEVECIWNYWVDTLGDPKCNNVTGPQADNACSYCCDNTNGNLPCNRNTIPTQLSTFQNSQKVEQCMTGSSISQYKLETCSSVASYCLNTVRYDTTAKHPEVYVEKRCAYEAECKGQWWEKTRNRPECLTQNFTGIADNNVICTYCCVSDGSGPCNGASVPEQIAHFGPVTTASTQTTATILSTTAHGHGHHNTHVQTDHGHHHTVTTTQTTTENTTTTPATIVCSGNTSIVCEDDPLAHCATLLSVGFCQKLQYNPDGEDVKFCPKTCNLCDKYCEYVLPPTTTPTATPTTTPAPTMHVTTAMTTTTHQTPGKPCPFCDANINCVWNQTCADSETCMVRAVLESGFQFSVHCTLTSDCHIMAKYIKTGEIFCCDDRSCIQKVLPGV
ncbi:uncharacterized protein LOC128191514 [Crassostrea angulata]|uniref:uncharacterized protein LOC128191514 n=1 Tax=Magallana angulata TaxID=2784310 RepID=UPI0022B1A2A1|nr:uncharacterized protein LOC128191514 [Crassostrea angulata]